MANIEAFTPRLRGILLNCRPREVARARQAIRSNLRSYETSVIETVEQCASEMVANAIEHLDSKELGGTVRLVIIELGDRIRVEVLDDGSFGNAPELKESTAQAESGRGLLIVEALSDAWGHHVDDQGRNVWFEVNIF